MSDRDGFMRRIVEEPADDTHRLVFADWLDETGGEDDRIRAEFIRVQVELSRLRALGDADPDHIKQLDRRQNAIYGITGSLRLTGTRPEQWRASSSAPDGRPETIGPPGYEWFVRGFVGAIELRAHQFTDATARWLFETFPVERVRLTDREPMEITTIDRDVPGYDLRRAAVWQWWGGDTRLSHPWRLPGGLTELLYRRAPKNRRNHVPGERTINCYFPEQESAHAALSDACVDYGRELVGLPALLPWAHPE